MFNFPYDYPDDINKLEEEFGCPVFMAQGNAGDMGNKQNRFAQFLPLIQQPFLKPQPRDGIQCTEWFIHK